MSVQPVDLPAVAPPTVEPGRRRLRVAWLWESRGRAALIVAALAILVFAWSVTNGFAYDDVAIIPGDKRVTEFHFWAMLRLPYWVNAADLAIYRPLTTVSFAVDWFIARGLPWFFHAVNVLEHGVASALVYLLLAELAAPVAAFAGALVFAVHPVHVEAVANVVGRAETMSAILYLWALLLWARAPYPSLRRAFAVGGLYLLAMLAKESSVTLPAALVLLDAALGRWSVRLSSLRRYALRMLPVLLACAAVLAGCIVLRERVLGRVTPEVVDPIFDLPMTSGARIMTALQAWPIFARLTFFPRTLLADYSPRIVMPAADWTASALLGLGIFLLLLVGGLEALARGRGRAALALLWFPLTILPVSNLLFPVGVIVAERTLYLPLLALSLGVALALERIGTLGETVRYACAGAGALALALLVLRTVTRIPVWDTTDRVFYALEADRPDSFRAAWHLARVAKRQHQDGLELVRYRKAVALWPFRRYLITEALGETVRLGRFAEARPLAAFAVAHWPDSPLAHRYLASTALATGDTVAARSAAQAGLRVAPADTGLLRVWRSVGGGPIR